MGSDTGREVSRGAALGCGWARAGSLERTRIGPSTDGRDIRIPLPPVDWGARGAACGLGCCGREACAGAADGLAGALGAA